MRYAVEIEGTGKLPGQPAETTELGLDISILGRCTERARTGLRFTT